MVNIFTIGLKYNSIVNLLVQLYNDLILSKRGPLARIWIAAHIEKKLSKKEAINTDIGQSVGMF